MERHQQSEALSGQVSLFGKLPSTSDYLRCNHDCAAGIALDEWLQQGMEELALAGVRWCPRPVRFVFAPNELDHVIAGLLAPSRDRAGRRFPVSVYCRLVAAPVSRDFAAVPRWLEHFLDQTEKLLPELATAAREDLPAKLGALSAPDSAALRARRQELAAHEAAREGELCGTDAAEAHQDLLAAIERAERTERTVVLDCPVHSLEHVGLWLALTERAYEGPMPSLFWNTQTESARLLVSLGEPPALLPVWLADPKRCSERLVKLMPRR